jgi:ATP-binding cassette subfamily B protein
MKALFQLNQYFLRYKWRLAIGFLFVTIAAIFRVYPAQLVRTSFDAVAKQIELVDDVGGLKMDELRSSLLFYGLAIIGSALLSGLFMFLMRQTIIVVSRYVEFDLKNDVFEHYQKLTLAFYKRNSTGDLMNRISEDVSRVRMYAGPAIMYTINVFVTLVIVISTMLSINMRLTLFVLFPLPILSWVIYKISQTINKRSEHVQRVLSELSTYVQEAFSGIRVLKAYGRETHSSKEFSDLANHYKDVNEGLFRVNALFFPMMLLLIGLSTLITIYIGGMEAIAGRISAGNIAEFVLYVNMLTWPVASIGWVTSIVQRAEASQERINEFLHTEPEIDQEAEGIKDFTNSIEFKNVSFTYPDTGIQALQDISFSLESGKTLAVVGRTGSGKTSLSHLILRLFDKQKGEILIGGVPIEKIDLGSLRRRTGYVPQEAFLFSDTIANNIGFSSDHQAMELVEQAAKDAEVDGNIQDFPNSYSTKVGERGITLSGGQKQRVSIARALMHDPDILLFDDCLSAVDTETEDKILQNLKRITAQRTTLIISHRVSSVKHADHILVLKKGKVVENGLHDDLLEAEGEYFELYQKQLREAQPS